MAGVADDFAFFCDHGMAALGAGIKEGLHLINGGGIFHDPSELQQGGKRCDRQFGFGTLVVHKSSLTRLFTRLNGFICA